ncbi:MAG: hypothetical protein OHK0041_23440 [Anaerolineales bacterium]
MNQMRSLRIFYQRHRLTLLASLTFLVSVILVGVITNLFSTILEIWFGQTPQRLLALVLGLVLLTLLAYGLIRLLSRETYRWLPLPREMHAHPHPVSIALVGPGPRRIYLNEPEKAPAAAAIRYHLGLGTLKQVWLIASDEGVPVAEELRRLYGGQVEIRLVTPPVRDILDVHETFDAANRLAGELLAAGWKPEEVIADYTGGTSSMSVGLALAALRNGFSMEFMSQVEGSESVPLQTGLQGRWKLSRRREA